MNPVERARVQELEDEVRRLRMENEFLKKAAPSSPGRQIGIPATATLLPILNITSGA
jgi:hypothetical protein